MAVTAGAGLLAVHPAFSHDAAGTILSRRDTVALATLIVPRAKNPAGWGRDVFEALKRNGIRSSRQNVCSVMAVIEQESTFTANPEVEGLGRMAEKEIEEKVKSISLLPAGAHAGVHLFLATRPSPEKSYLKLIRAAKTERDLDLVFRNMAFYLFREYATTRLLNTPAVAARVDAVNPVSTLGSMQVSIAYAAAEVEKAKGRRLTASAIWKLRDELYTRAGGVNYGTRMLLGYHAGYESRLYVFADFNAGRYASRNAAFQHMVAELSGDQLALDGDLLIYGNGEALVEPSATEKAVRRLDLGLGEKEIRADLLHGKAYGFRDTATYGRVSAAYGKKTGRKAPYAMVPQIRLKSPKITSNMTTERFARAVMRRYEKCLKVR